MSLTKFKIIIMGQKNLTQLTAQLKSNCIWVCTAALSSVGVCGNWLGLGHWCTANYINFSPMKNERKETILSGNLFQFFYHLNC